MLDIRVNYRAKEILNYYLDTAYNRAIRAYRHTFT